MGASGRGRALVTEEKTIELFKCLADRSRLQILKSLSGEPMYVERLAERLGLTPPTVSFHLKKLENAGLVDSTKEQYYVTYRLREDALGARIIDLIREESTEKQRQAEREQAHRQKVIDSFFEYGKLKTIPVQQKKRRIILEEMLKRFERDRKYPEREVNLIIADFHDDFCTLRRDMISEKLMAREGGIYWRIDGE